MAVINPYGGMASSLDADELDALCAAVAGRKCRNLVGAGAPDEAADLRRPHPPCPSCGFPDCAHDGRAPAGRQNWFVYLFRVRRDEGKWPRTARVLRHLLMSDSYYRSSW